MPIDPTRLYTQLLNTGLQNKDTGMYQLLREMIRQLADLNLTTTAIAGSVTNETINNIIGNPFSIDSGSDSLDDSISIPGRDGSPGRDGYSIPGLDGIDGEDAPIIQGPIGNTGATGAIGPTGPIGIGIDGLDGEDSFPIPGPIGATGSSGINGINGINGVPGLDGYDADDVLPIPGPIGPSGANGATGSIGIGIPGYDGEAGEDAMIIQGPRGLEGPMVPYFLAAGDTFTVPIYKQGLFAINIDNEGIITVDGFLVEVDDEYTPPCAVLSTLINVLPSDTSPQLLSLENVELNNGFTLGSTTAITILEPGLYLITLLASIGEQITGGPIHTGVFSIDIWLAKNGVNVPYIVARGTTDLPQIQTVTFTTVIRLTGGDTISGYFAVVDITVTNSGIISDSVVGEPTFPAARLTITKVGD